MGQNQEGTEVGGGTFFDDENTLFFKEVFQNGDEQEETTMSIDME